MNAQEKVRIKDQQLDPESLQAYLELSSCLRTLEVVMMYHFFKATPQRKVDLKNLVCSHLQQMYGNNLLYNSPLDCGPYCDCGEYCCECY